MAARLEELDVKKTLTSLALTTLAVGVLAGCGAGSESADAEGGGSQTEDYCVELEQQQDTISGFEAQPSGEQIEQAFTAFEDLAATAPAEVEEQWTVVSDAFGEVRQAIQDAGIDLSDFAGLQSGEVPEDVDPAALAELGQTVQGLDSEELTAAFEAIETHADSECGIDLSGEGS